MAVGYGVRMPDGSRDVMPFVDARGMAAATGLTSTVEDMARFVSAQFRQGKRGDDRLLSTASLREMHRVRMLESTWTSGQGIGFSVSRANGKIYVGHGGGYPGYTTGTRIELDSKVGAIVLTNTNDSNPGADRHRAPVDRWSGGGEGDESRERERSMGSGLESVCRDLSEPMGHHPRAGDEREARVDATVGAEYR